MDAKVVHLPDDVCVELEQTKELMSSSDYKKRFKAEYYQLAIRIVRLERMCAKWDAGKLAFTPTVERSIYDVQISTMKSYLDVLKLRAAKEKIPNLASLDYLHKLIAEMYDD